MGRDLSGCMETVAVFNLKRVNWSGEKEELDGKRVRAYPKPRRIWGKWTEKLRADVKFTEKQNRLVSFCSGCDAAVVNHKSGPKQKSCGTSRYSVFT